MRACSSCGAHKRKPDSSGLQTEGGGVGEPVLQCIMGVSSRLARLFGEESLQP